MECKTTTESSACLPLTHDQPTAPSRKAASDSQSQFRLASKATAEDQTRLSFLSWREVRMQCVLAGPLIVGYLLFFALQVVSTIFVGHVGELELSGAAIANSFANATGLSIVLGMGSAMETLCGQAYGAKQYKKMGIYLQRAILVLNAVSLPLAFLWANVEHILVALNQDANIARKAGEYMVWLIPTLFGNATSYPFSKFLQAQSIVNPQLLINLVVLVCHVPICWFLVFKSGMGFTGAALANSISIWLKVLLLGLFVRFSAKCAKTRASLSKEVLEDLKGFFKLAIPSAAMICLEWWSFEILVILAGFLANPELQTATISICASASIRVSNELGAGHPQKARRAVNVAVCLALLEALLVATIILLVQNVWGAIYSSEREVVLAVASLMPLLALSTTFDGLQIVLSGVVRGAGMQNAGAIINLVSFYGAVLPVSSVLAFVLSMESKGLWLGLVLGTGTQFFIYSTITQFTDWKKQAQKAADRVQAHSSLTEPILEWDGN